MKKGNMGKLIEKKKEKSWKDKELLKYKLKEEGMRALGVASGITLYTPYLNTIGKNFLSSLSYLMGIEVYVLGTSWIIAENLKKGYEDWLFLSPSKKKDCLKEKLEVFKTFNTSYLNTSIITSVLLSSMGVIKYGGDYLLFPSLILTITTYLKLNLKDTKISELE